MFRKELRELRKGEREELWSWIATLTEKEDNEDGKMFRDWLELHSKDPADSVYVFFTARTSSASDSTTQHAYTTTQEETIVGVASLVKDDYGRIAPEGGWILGGVNVRREWRGKGVGSAIVKAIIEEVKLRVRREKLDIPIKLISVNGALIHKLYAPHGWIPTTDEWPEEDIPCLQVFSYKQEIQTGIVHPDSPPPLSSSNSSSSFVLSPSCSSLAPFQENYFRTNGRQQQSDEEVGCVGRLIHRYHGFGGV